MITNSISAIKLFESIVIFFIFKNVKGNKIYSSSSGYCANSFKSKTHGS